MSKNKATGNFLLVANWESNVGYAWWLMENFWINIAAFCSEQNLKCFLIYPKITIIPDTIKKTDIEIAELSFFNNSKLDQQKLKQYIVSNNINHIYLTDAPFHSQLYLQLRMWGVKNIIIHDHTPGDREASSQIKQWIKHVIQRIPYYSADHFIAVTEFVRERIINVACVPKKQCHCAPNGINPVDLSTIDPEYAHDVFEIPKDRILVVNTGRATYYKGIDFIIHCADRLINQLNLKYFHFIYCGDGPDLQDFKNLVSRLNLDSHFTFAGKRNDIRKILPSCDIGFHAAQGEVGYSLSILEYMSSGLLTLVPNLPSTSLATIHGENGFCFEYGNVESATQTIIDAENHPEKEAIINCAIKTVQERYNIHNTNKIFLSIIQQIVLN